MTQYFRAESGVGASPVAFAHRPGNRKPAHIESAALITEQRSMPAGARGATVSIVAKRRRARAGYKNDCRRLPDRRKRRIQDR